ncbi:snaclec bitiscetin subunit alpha-like isoform X2 [Stigmatopora argus]
MVQTRDSLRLFLRQVSAVQPLALTMVFTLGLLLLIFGLQIGTTAIRQNDRCPEGWTQLNNRCYIFKETSLTFDLAEKSCVQLGGHLASIQNDIQRAVVNELTQAAIDVSGVWIGLCLLSGSPLWTDGSDIEFGIEEVRSQPDGCVKIELSEFAWLTEDREMNLPYICARDVFQCALICSTEDLHLI